MVHRLDFDLGLHRLAAAADGGGSGDYSCVISVGKFLSTWGKSEKRAFCFKDVRCSCNVFSMPYYFTAVYLPLTAPADCSYPFDHFCNF